MMSMAEATRTIAFKVRTASCAGTACVNSFGDEQLAVDVLADNLLFEALRYSVSQGGAGPPRGGGGEWGCSARRRQAARAAAG
jgi:hypothetical protein